MSDTEHGLTVEDVGHAKHRRTPAIPAGSEPCDTGLTDLPDLRDVPLGQIADAARNGHDPTAETRQRIAPGGGRTLLVAASFNSAI